MVKMLDIVMHFEDGSTVKRSVRNEHFVSIDIEREERLMSETLRYDYGNAEDTLSAMLYHELGDD